MAETSRKHTMFVKKEQESWCGQTKKRLLQSEASFFILNRRHWETMKSLREGDTVKWTSVGGQ